MVASLRRTVPFLSPRDHSLVVDSVRLEPGQTPRPQFMRRLAESLDLSRVSHLFPADIAAELIEEQYEVCLDHIYSDPVWQDFREGRGKPALLAYLLETRHYLDSAPSRMSPGVAAGWRDGPTEMALALHLVEEAGHAVFPEEALGVLGCQASKTRACRPLPGTTEWIYLMRALASRDPLIAAICSGLLEFSAADKRLVLGWHDMLVSSGLLAAGAVTAIRKHVDLDMELGHGSIWREVLREESPLSCRRLRDCLNSVVAVAEMLVRWCGMLRTGLSGDIVSALPTVEIEPPSAQSVVADPTFFGLPVWPSRILHEICYGASLPAGTRQVLALSYYLDHRTQSAQSEVERLSRRLLDATDVEGETDDPANLKNLLLAWLRTIDGHVLWQEMIDDPTVALIWGWLLENYFYLRSAVGHISGAIYACPDPLIRSALVEHLDEERDHAKALKLGLGAVKAPSPVDWCRPLATTVSFLGLLKELAIQDWKAYCLGIVFLQSTRKPGDVRHVDFYKRIAGRCPAAQPLVRAMQDHDALDEGLAHHNSADDLLAMLSSRHAIDHATLARAALLPQLAWSFLDGIRVQYGKGEPSLAQRIGWLAN